MARYREVFKYQLVITRKTHVDLMTVTVELKENVSGTLPLQRSMERDIEELLGVRGSVQIVPRGTLPDGHRKIEDQRKWE
jgi:phenylacetate-CoA ligase